MHYYNCFWNWNKSLLTRLYLTSVKCYRLQNPRFKKKGSCKTMNSCSLIFSSSYKISTNDNSRLDENTLFPHIIINIMFLFYLLYSFISIFKILPFLFSFPKWCPNTYTIITTCFTHLVISFEFIRVYKPQPYSLWLHFKAKFIRGGYPKFLLIYYERFTGPLLLQCQ